MSLHERIAKARKDKGITQEELADMANVTVRTIQRIESGESIPRSFTLKALAKALDQSYEWLTADEPGIRTEMPSNDISHFLKMFNLSCFTYIVLPWIHFLVPVLILNRQKRDLPENVVAFSRKIIRQQIYWVIALNLIMFFIAAINFVQGIAAGNSPYFVSYLWAVFIMYTLNAGIIFYNLILIRKRF